jgi:hypothetical protein
MGSAKYIDCNRIIVVRVINHKATMSNMYGYSDYDGPKIVKEPEADQDCYCENENEQAKLSNNNNDNETNAIGTDDIDDGNPLQVGFWMDGDSLAPPCGTSISTIHEILQFLHITSKDVLYDLGCGDGRICLEAYCKYQCKAIGIEVEPDLVHRAQTLITKLSQQEQPSSYNCLPQVFCMDLRLLFEKWMKNDQTITTTFPNVNAPMNGIIFPLPTIVFLYLLPESLLEIELQLSNLLNAVTTASCRIVCNTWGIPHWKPTQQISIMESSAMGVSTTVYVYTKDSLPT